MEMQPSQLCRPCSSRSILNSSNTSQMLIHLQGAILINPNQLFRAASRQPPQKEHGTASEPQPFAQLAQSSRRARCTCAVKGKPKLSSRTSLLIRACSLMRTDLGQGFHQEKSAERSPSGMQQHVASPTSSYCTSQIWQDGCSVFRLLLSSGKEGVWQLNLSYTRPISHM